MKIKSKKKTFIILGIIQLIVLTSCSKDEDIAYELMPYPSDIISTPIYTSNFPLSVEESQTPINIESSKAIPFYSNDPILHYGAVNLNSVMNNAGENLRINVNNTDSFNNYITVGRKKYNLVNFHFHYSSEHTINGSYSKMEIHFVNISANNSYAVLSILVDSGADNPALQNLFTLSPTTNNGINSPNTTFDLSTLFPSSTGEYYTYSGSLTTPNFNISSAMTNGGPVTWFVYKNKQHVSDSQFNAYTTIYTEPNFRAIQPLNGRKVYSNSKN